MPSDTDILSPSTVLFNILESGNYGNEVGGQDDMNAQNIARLLGSIMMNGLPVMCLDDYLHMSDYLNQNINERTYAAIMESPVLKGQFGTLIRARKMQIRLSPNNCWTKAFVKHMKKTSALFRVSNTLIQSLYALLLAMYLYNTYAQTMDVRSYRSMYKATSRHCCENVWLVIEIVSKNNICPNNAEWDILSPDNVPSVTLRFHPSSIPDSRNVL